LPPYLWQRFGRVVELIDEEKIRNATKETSKAAITIHTFKSPKTKTASAIVSPSGSPAANDTVDTSPSASQAAPASVSRSESRSSSSFSAKKKSTVHFAVSAEPSRIAVRQYTIEWLPL
jgi:hypothetical protein